MYGTRAEHLAWCKQRALENHGGMTLMVMLAAAGRLDRAAELRKFIEGFN